MENYSPITRTHQEIRIHRQDWGCVTQHGSHICFHPTILGFKVTLATHMLAKRDPGLIRAHESMHVRRGKIAVYVSYCLVMIGAY